VFIKLNDNKIVCVSQTKIYFIFYYILLCLTETRNYFAFCFKSTFSILCEVELSLRRF
jgi:hypothetical protein